MILGMDPIVKCKPDRITWNLDEKKIVKFKEKVKIGMVEWNNIFKKNKHDIESLDLLAEYFQLLIVDAAKEVFGFKRFNNRSAKNNRFPDVTLSLLNTFLVE